MTAEQASGQAEQPSGDVPTSQEGQPIESVASSIPPAKEEPKAEQKDAAKTPNEEAKHWRKSDKEWQEAQEKAKEAETLKEEKAKVEKSLKDEVEELKALNKRRDWELDHPIVREEKYREAWEAKLKEKEKLIKSGDLSLDEVWQLVSREDHTAVRKAEAEQQVRDQGSVPSASRSAPQKPGLDQATLDMGRAWGNKPEDFEKYGIR